MVTGIARPDKATNLSLGAAAVALANAILSNMLAFGVHMTAEQQASIQGTLNALVLFVLAAVHLYSAITAERDVLANPDAHAAAPPPPPPSSPPSA